MAEDEVDDDVTQELGTLVAAYALDAVSAEERVRFESLLASHEELAREVEDLRSVAGLLAAPFATAPPARVRMAVLAQLSQMGQLLPQVEPAVVPSSAPDTMGSRAAAGSPGSASVPLPAGVGDLVGRRARHVARTRRSTGWRQSVAVALVAAAVAVGAVFVGQGNTFRSRTATADSAFSQVVAQPDAVLAHPPLKTAGTATVAWSAAEQRAVVSLANVSAAPAGRTYQLWLINSSGPAVSEGVFATSGGSAQLSVAGFRAGQQVGITVEPTGGSRQPTTVPILTQSLT